MKNNLKRVFALLIAVVMCVTCTLPVFASDAAVVCPGEGEVHSKANCNSYVEVDVVAASCGTIGYTKYQCSHCNTGFIDDIVEGNDECVIVDVDYKAATCVEDGYDKKKCTAHDVEINTVLPALSTADPKAHTWGAWVENTDGETQTRTCDVCGATETENVAPHTVHVWDNANLEFTKVPTCTEDGTAVIKCTECDATKTIPVYKTSEYATHTYDLTNYTEVSAATCESYAIWTVTCTVCGFVNNEYENAAGGYAEHDFSVPVDAQEPGCVTPGWIAHNKCSVCETPDNTNVGVDPVGHNWAADPDKEDVEAVCGQNGVHYIKCTVCGAEDSEVTQMPSDHTFAAEPLKKDPTCTEPGIIVKYCLNCLKEIEAQYLAPLGHHLATCTDHAACEATNGYACGLVVSGETAGDCENVGTVTYTCSVCSAYSITLDKAPTAGAGQHSLKTSTTASTCTTPGSTYQYCEFCTYTTNPVELPLDPDNHVYDNVAQEGWVIATAPTCTNPGVAIKYCVECLTLDTEESILPALGHTMPAGTQPTVAATCQNKASYTYVCETCLETVIEEKGELADHDYELHAAVEPECGVGGNYAYYTCNTAGCTLYFDADKNVIEGIPTRDALVHNWSDVEWTAPTCTNPVVKEQRHCDLCDTTEVKLDENGKEIVHVVDYANAANHDCNHTELYAVREGTCTAPAIYVWYCASAYNAKVEATIDGATVTVIPHKATFWEYDDTYGKGHVIGAPYMSETTAAVTATCLVEGKTAIYTCSSCNATIGGENLGYADHTYEFHDAVAAGCTTAGNDAYYVCTVAGCGDYFDANKTPIESIPMIDATGHTYVETVVAATCEENGYTRTTCENCDYSVDSNPVAALTHDYVIVQNITVGCENVGFIHVLCRNEVCNSDADVNYMIHEYIYSYVYATGHDMETAPDCVTGDVHTCANGCGYTYTDPARGVHTNANGDVLTCQMDTGITDRVCADCGETINEGTHTKITVTTSATCTENGYKVTTCKHCDLYETEQVANKTGHSEPTDFTVQDPATCMGNGLKVKVCENGCGTTLASEVIPQVSHSFEGRYVEDWAADICVAGQETATCAYGCGTTDVKPIPALEGIVFSYEYDNYVKAGCDFVNSGMIAVTVKYEANNASVNSILLAFEFNKAVMTYVESVPVYTGFNAELCEVGFNNETGKVSISARANSEFSEAGKVDVVLDGEGVLCTLVFAINDLAADNTNLDLSVVPGTVDQGSTVVNKDNAAVAVKYGTPVAPMTTDKLGDVNNDGVVTDADTVMLVDYLFAAEGETNYSAQADIDQNGVVDLNDYLLLKQFTISSITYEDMCSPAEA